MERVWNKRSINSRFLRFSPLLSSPLLSSAVLSSALFRSSPLLSSPLLSSPLPSFPMQSFALLSSPPPLLWWQQLHVLLRRLLRGGRLDVIDCFETVATRRLLRGVCLEEAWFVRIYIYTYFRLRNGASGPDIADFRGPSGPLIPQNPLEKAGGEAPHLFQVVLR